MPMNPRTCIRNYIVAMLRQTENSDGKTYLVDVGGRVYAERETPVFKIEMPIVLVYFEEETAETFAGDKYRADEYMNILNIVIDVQVDGGIVPNTEDQLMNYKTEDDLDKIAYQCELLLYDDMYLGRLLKEYNPNNGHGLLEGSKKTGVTPYMVSTSGERKISAQRLRWKLYYRTDGFVDKKLDPFLEFNAKFLRVGTTVETGFDPNDIDPDNILIEAKGVTQ